MKRSARLAIWRVLDWVRRRVERCWAAGTPIVFPSRWISVMLLGVRSGLMWGSKSAGVSSLRARPFNVKMAIFGAVSFVVCWVW